MWDRTTIQQRLPAPATTQFRGSYMDFYPSSHQIVDQRSSKIQQGLCKAADQQQLHARPSASDSHA